MYFSLNVGTQKAHLQWYPFAKLSPYDKAKIASEGFYNAYIKTASFMLFPSAMHQSESYLQKADGSFRDSSVVAPILFLVLEAMGLEIHNRYSSARPPEASVHYGGSYGHLRAKYKQDYDAFFKELIAVDKYQYFIKTDIANFYGSIRVDKLIAQIDKACNSCDVAFSQEQLLLFKELLLYCGDGRFPIIDNSLACTYLSTVVYLDAADKALHEYISASATFSSFKMVRYVDDMYILIASDEPIENLRKSCNQIKEEYSSILREVGLSLNMEKCCFEEANAIFHVVKKSLYDGHFACERQCVGRLFADALPRFLSDISSELLLGTLDAKAYNELIIKHFSSDDTELAPGEVFNYFVYEDEAELRSQAVTEQIAALAEQDGFVSLDPSRLIVLIMRTQSEEAIGGVAEQLLRRNCAGKWNAYDTNVAISFLMQTDFIDEDLLDVLSVRAPNLYSYYSDHCKDSTAQCFSDWQANLLCEITAQDSMARYLYFLHLCEMKRLNYMLAFACYKKYFDRVTALLDFALSGNPSIKAPNYSKFRNEGALVKFYSAIDGSEAVIKTAQRLASANPLAHSSCGLTDSSNTPENLCEAINALSSLMLGYIGQAADA